MLERLEALVGPESIKHPETAEVSRDELRDLLAVAKAAQEVRRTHKDARVHDRDCSIARRELYEALAPLLREADE